MPNGRQTPRLITPYDDAHLVIACLATPLYGYPYEAMCRALELKERVTPLLLAHLKEVAATVWYKLSAQQQSLTTYGLYLLASFREERAFAPILAYYQAHYAKLGLMRRIDMRRLLGSTYEGSLPLLDAVISNPQYDPFLRREAVLTLAVAHKAGKISRDCLLAYLSDLLARSAEDEELLGAVYELCRDLHAKEILAAIRASVARSGAKHHDLAYIVDDLEKTMQRPFYEAYKVNFADNGAYDAVYDAMVETMSSYTYMPAEEKMPHDCPRADRGQAGSRRPAKAGRNQPCPCGSGQKHKRCCLRRALSPQASQASNQLRVVSSQGA